MRAPAFWNQRGVLAWMLLPVSWLYTAVAVWRSGKPPRYKAGIPVVCIGNVVAGGAGKTPLAMALGRLLQQRGLTVHFLSRGYGGSLPGPVQVQPGKHTAAEVGDEPLLLAEVAPCWVAKSRVAGAQAAEAAGAQVILMDDGFQNPALHKDISLLVLDGGYGIGNGYCLPAGPLREPLAVAAGRCQAVVLVDEKKGEHRDRVQSKLPQSLPVLMAFIRPEMPAWCVNTPRVVAFAGIGRPKKFFDSLRALPLSLVATRSFPDHHAYREAEIRALQSEAAAQGALLVTTRKDWVRLPEPLRVGIEVLDVTLGCETMEHWEPLLTMIENAR